MVTKVSSSNFSSTLISSLSGPTVTGIQYLDNSYNILSETAIPLTGGYIYVNGTGFVSGCQVTVDGTVATSVSFVSSTQLLVQVPAMTTGTYPIYVINPNGSIAIKVFGINYAMAPSWVTGQTLTQNAGVVNIQLSAISGDAVTYTLTSGYTLPTGLTLSSGGLLSGTLAPSVDTTYTFNVTATDNELQATAQAFSITITTSDPYFNYVSMLLNGESVNATATGATFVTDASTNNTQLTIVGSTKANSFNPYTPGYYSNYFNGSAYVSVAASTGLQPGTGDFTFECWVYPTALGSALASQQVIFNSQGSNSFSVAIWNNDVHFAQYNVADLFDFTTTGLINNTWAHIAITRASSSLKCFVNGVQAGSTQTSATNFTGSGPGYIGAGGSGAYNYSGYISNLRFIKGQALYTSNFTTSQTPLQLTTNTTFLTSLVNSIVDTSTNQTALTNSSALIASNNPFATKYVAGTPYYSIKFNGTSDYLTVPSSTGFTGSTFTFEGWIYLTGYSPNYTSNYQAAIVTCDNNVNGFEWNIIGTSSSWTGFNFFSRSGGSNTNVIDPTYNFQLNTWYHVAAVSNGTTLTQYVNGISVGSSSIATWTDIGSPLYIGLCSISGYSYYFPGYISNLRVVKGTAVYTGNFTPPTSPLNATQSAGGANISAISSGTVFLTCQNNTIIDNSINNYTITAATTTVKPVAVSPFTPNSYTSTQITNYGSAYFNGTTDYITFPTSGMVLGSNNFTIEGWFYATVSPSTYTCRVFSYYQPGTAGVYPMFYFDSSNKVEWGYNGTSMVTTSGTVPTNIWFHLAIVRSSGTSTVYINGANSGSATDNSVYLAGGPGSLGGIGSYYYQGYISDFRITNGTAVYTSNFVPPINTYNTAITNTQLLTLQNNINPTNFGFTDNSNFNNAISRPAGNANMGNFSPYSQNGWSNYFDGSSGYLTVTSGATPTSENFTIECFIYLPGNLPYLNSSSTYTSYIMGGVGTGLFQLYVSGTGSTSTPTGIGVGAYGAGASFSFSGTPTSFPIGQWNHVALSRNGSLYGLWFNGTQIATYTNSYTFTSGTPYIAAAPGATGYLDYFQGYISNFRWVKNTYVYNPSSTTITVPTSPLTAVPGTYLLTCQSPRYVDNSGAPFTVTPTGTTSVQAFSPFKSMNSVPTAYGMLFNGSTDYVTVTPNTSLALSSGNWTIDCWIYPTSVAIAQNIVADWRNSASSNNPVFYMVNTTMYWRVNQVSLLSGTIPAANTWYHLAVVKNNSTTVMYINGVANSSAVDTITYAIDQFQVGKAQDSNYWNGYISNFRVIKGVAVYTGNFNLPTTASSAYYNGTQSTFLLNSNTLSDSSGNNLTVTMSGAPKVYSFNPFGTTINSSPVAYSPTINGGSAYFNGSTDYISTPVTVFLPATNTYTIEMWMYPIAFPGSSNIVSLYQLSNATVSNFGELILEWYGSGNFRVEVRPSTNGSIATITTASTYSLNQWIHVAISVNAGAAILFVNGVNSGTGTVTAMDGTQTFSSIGYLTNGYTSGQAYFNGYLSDVRITKNQSLYLSNFYPPTTPLTASSNTTLLLNFNNGAVIDAHSSSTLSTLGGGSAISTSIKKYGNGSLAFNGTSQYLTSMNSTMTSLSTGNFTIEFWIYPTTSSQTCTIFDTRPSGSNGVYPTIILSTGAIIWYVSSANQITGSTLTTNTWTHVAVVRNNGLTHMYIGGTQSGSVYTDTNAYLSSAPIAIGSSTNSLGSSFFAGYIDEFRITRIARYTTTFTPPVTYVPYK